MRATIFTTMGISPMAGPEVERPSIYATEIGPAIADVSAGISRLTSHLAITRMAKLTRYFPD